MPPLPRSLRHRLLALGLIAVALGCPPATGQTLPKLIGEAPPPVNPSMPATLPVVSAQSLVEIPMGPESRNRCEIDANTLAIDEERLVRYALVITSPSGARNVSYEALRCDRRERRILALGRPDGSWSVLPDSPWRDLPRGDPRNRHHAELFERLCQGGAAASLKPERLRQRLRETPGNPL
ncbi:MAG: hypothetical protein NTV19_11395 [Burkholderiales bacterium]|nr:hypothetical protein [Burkholderiales bacterium]